jgi:hypothetical protein
MTTKIRLTADAYIVGLIYVKPLEMHAITAMLDEHTMNRFQCALGTTMSTRWKDWQPQCCNRRTAKRSTRESGDREYCEQNMRGV